MGEHTLTESELIGFLANSTFDGKQNNLIIIDNEIRKFLSQAYSDKVYLESNKIVAICKVSNDDLYHPDEYTKKQLIESLVYGNESHYMSNGRFIARRSIPAFDDFSKLAVKLQDIYCLGYNELGKWNIISPISLEDSKKIKGLSKPDYVDYITNQETFEKLVRYVFEHSKDGVNQETIIREYKRLIECYYDIVNRT